MANQAYDPKILQEFADNLYYQARSIQATYLLGGLFLGFFAPLLAPRVSFDAARLAADFNLAVVVGISVLVGGLIGYVAGRSRAFKLKLQAQQVLCQVAIEANTRATWAAASGVQ